MPPQARALVAQIFRVLGEPARLSLLERLQSGEASVGELAQVIETSQPNASKHLKTLQQAGLVNRRQDGTTAYYSISDPMVFELCRLVCGSIQQRIQDKLDADRQLLAAIAQA